jgi:pilus assembly protein CpaB
MNRRAIIPLLVGLGIGLLAVKFAISTIRKAQASSESNKTVTVVRAKLDIAAHEEIQKDMVETVATADSLFAPANERMDKVDTAIGRVTAKPIPKNAPVLLSMLAPEGTRPGMVGRIPSGYRAVSVKIDEISGVAYQMQPGDWVDVIVVMDIDAGTKGKKETIAEVILQHIQVAAIGYGTDPEADAKQSKMKPAKSATLMVPEEEVPKLHLAGTRGKITLAMRGEDDIAQNSPAVAHGREIMKGTTPEPEPAPPVLAAAPAAEPEPYMVMVFHGTTTNQAPTVERITFENTHSSKIMDVTNAAPKRATISGGKGRSPAAAPQPNGAAKATGDQDGSQGTEPGDVDTEDENKPDAGE